MTKKVTIRFGIGDKRYTFEITNKFVSVVDRIGAKKDDMLHNKFKVTVKNLENNKKISFYFYDSYDNYLKGKKTLSCIDMIYAFRCYLEDALSFADYNIDEFAKEFFGNDEKISVILKTYKLCEKAFLKVARLLGSNDGIDEEIRKVVNFLIDLENENKLKSIIVRCV